MRYEIILAPAAVSQLRALRAHVRREVEDVIERHLRFEPKKVSKSRIKRLRGFDQPQFRLRAGEVRVFYDVEKERVEVLAVIDKAEAAKWLEAEGRKPGESTAGQSEG
jgi:mRNA-degrading endonuclease RelE of RelBE toxin-antitoxin system